MLLAAAVLARKAMGPVSSYLARASRCLVPTALASSLTIGAAAGLAAASSVSEEQAVDVVAGGVLVIESEPTAADVTLDGQILGRTPLTLRDLSEGEHVLILVRPGYLENRRVIRGRPGETGALRVSLTRQPEVAAPAAGGRAAKGRKGHGLRTPLLIAAPLVAGGAAYLIATKARPPEIRLEPPQPTGRAVVHVTNATFTAVATDGEGLRYEWTFGDGAVASGGPSVGHVFVQTGDLTVTVTASRGDAKSSASVVVGVGSLAGEWSLSIEGRGSRTLRIEQNGGLISGEVRFSDTWGYATIAGAGEHPRRVRFSETFRGGGTLGFEGEAESSLDRIFGKASNGESWELRRQ